MSNPDQTISHPEPKAYVTETALLTKYHLWILDRNLFFVVSALIAIVGLSLVGTICWYIVDSYVGPGLRRMAEDNLKESNRILIRMQENEKTAKPGIHLIQSTRMTIREATQSSDGKQINQS